jgi:hypothetical protein
MRSNLAEAQRQDGLLGRYATAVDAERKLFAKRDRSLRWLADLARKHAVELGDQPADLQAVEDLYFKLFGEGAGWLRRRDRSTFESAMGVFWGAIAVAHGATWEVYESPFAPGHFGLAVSRGLLTVVLDARCSGWDRRPNNKRRELLRREFDKTFGRA